MARHRTQPVIVVALRDQQPDCAVALQLEEGVGRQQHVDVVRAGVEVDIAADMRDVVRRAFECSEPGDVVLLAPACASFDMFESFEHRGKVFKEEILNLRSEIEI